MKSKIVSCKINEETEELIKEKIQKLDITRSRVIELAIVDGLKNRINTVDLESKIKLRETYNLLNYKILAGVQIRESDLKELEKVVDELCQ